MGVYSAINNYLFPSDIARLLNHAGKFPRRTPHRFTFRGLKFQVTDFLSVAWQIKEILVDEDLKFDPGTSSPLIYDCGANAGVSVLYFKKQFPRASVNAFEPDPDVFECLQKNIGSNSVSGVHSFQQAVWKENGQLEFSADGADGGALTTVSSGTIKVNCIRLRDLLEKEKQVDLLKVDIEGAEVPVILDIGDVLKKIRFVFIEYHSRPGQKQELDQLLACLTSQGFRYRIRSLNSGAHHLFQDKVPQDGMDIQLNIYATRRQDTE